jgi:hypothetical protein
MRFEHSTEIDATQQRVWDAISNLEAWQNIVTTIEDLEILTPPPVDTGSRVRLKQFKLPEGTWTVTGWTPPSAFEWQQQESGVTSVAGHRIEALGPDRARLSLTLDMRGLLIPIMGRFYKNLINDYMRREAEGMKRAAESRSG